MAQVVRSISCRPQRNRESPSGFCESGSLGLITLQMGNAVRRFLTPPICVFYTAWMATRANSQFSIACCGLPPRVRTPACGYGRAEAKPVRRLSEMPGPVAMSKEERKFQPQTKTVPSNIEAYWRAADPDRLKFASTRTVFSARSARDRPVKVANGAEFPACRDMIDAPAAARRRMPRSADISAG